MITAWLFGFAPLSALVLLFAWGLDQRFGDPQWRAHPVRLIGHSIAIGERLFYRERGGRFVQFVGGLILIVLLVALFAIGGFALHWQLTKLPTSLGLALYYLIDGVALWFAISLRSLIDEGRRVWQLTEHGTLSAARQALSMIVGRDTAALERPEIRRAVLETLSENLSDGVVVPLFWYLIGGLPLLLVVKLISTADSMIGYKSERYLWFGRVAARLDDLFCLIPARLTALALLCVGRACRLTQLSAVRREAVKHASPNAGYPEAALALVLGLRLGGPAIYAGKLSNKPWIGAEMGRLEPTAGDLEQTVSLLQLTTLILLTTFVFAIVAVRLFGWI